ncbi:hypothetical protein DFH08DRAFT_1049433 [Mycena albidolilacea]|uniref:Uncharacterized protein n=1 Tax=Mycena albidolilacea TaxID=1033008 RepID=A0AAD6Z6E0_9AGAR|nr:hypothetical protein DFH08DRAFT_1049433 [Mycena albidolilacea]
MKVDGAIVASQKSRKKQEKREGTVVVCARTPDKGKNKTRQESKRIIHRKNNPTGIGFLRIPSLPPLHALPQSSESLCPESLSLPLPLGVAREEEAREEYDHRWRGALEPHVGTGVGAGDAGGAGAGAGEITHTSSTISLFPPLPFPFPFPFPLKTVALPIGFGFEAEGDLGKCIYRRTPAARANANVFGDDATPGERRPWAWAECTEESGEEAGAGVQGGWPWDARRESGSTANASLNCDARGRGCQPVYRPGPAIGAEPEHADADANGGLGSGRGEGGKLHFSSVGDGDSGEEGEGEDGTHATSGESGTSSGGDIGGNALRLRWEAPLRERRGGGRGEQSGSPRAAHSSSSRWSRLPEKKKKEEGDGVPNGAYAVQSPLQGVLSASVGRGVFGGARVRETRDKVSDGREAKAEAEAASEYEWEWECEVTIGGGGGARVGMGMLARTTGVRLRQTEALFVKAVEAEVAARATRAEPQTWATTRTKGKQGRTAAAAGRGVEVEATGCGEGGTGDTARLAIASGLMLLHRITACPLSSAATSWLSAVGEGVGVVGNPLDTGLAEPDCFPRTRSSRSAEGAGTDAGTGSQSPSTVVVRPSWRYMDVVRRVEWKVAGADSAKARKNDPQLTNRSSFQLGLEDDLNAFVSFIVFRKTFEQSKAVDNM